MIHVNARAIIERETSEGVEIILQTRNKPHEGGKWLELPGGRIEEFESVLTSLRREVEEETGLTLTSIEGADARIEVGDDTASVECLRPFAVYQTTRGPVDSMGVYFRCKAEGRLLSVGDDAENAQWVPVGQVADWMAREPERFFWIDRAGVSFYLKTVGM